MSDQFDLAENDLPQGPPAAASGSDETTDTLNDETSRDNARAQHTSSGDGKTPASTTRNRRGRGTRAARTARSDAAPDGILQLPVQDEAQPARHDDETDAVAELEAQGFTADEAIRLVHVSGRVATSREAREAEATLRRLRFTRWLVERGMLDEFSA
ncbi:MAG TPA: hypothetical protein VKQ30_24510 [Ktedonobacterales bacterium]|nr:hypothetical protein [Ktedonobacterales bacterium]